MKIDTGNSRPSIFIRYQSISCYRLISIAVDFIDYRISSIGQAGTCCIASVFFFIFILFYIAFVPVQISHHIWTVFVLHLSRTNTITYLSCICRLCYSDKCNVIFVLHLSCSQIWSNPLFHPVFSFWLFIFTFSSKEISCELILTNQSVI